MNSNSPSFDAECLTKTNAVVPSVDFIHAISEFLDTDPKDLLVEMGYYDRPATESSALTDAMER